MYDSVEFVVCDSVEFVVYDSVESTALRLITGLGSAEVQPQLSRLVTEPNRPGFLSGDSEELNRALVLTLARSMHITGRRAAARGTTLCSDFFTLPWQICTTPYYI